MDRPEHPSPPRTDPYRIVKMPSQELLEDFLRGMSGRITVVFDTRTGAFERIADRRFAAGDQPRAS